ncbi:MAG: hypothetical protein EA355_04335 [Rhodobacteraceae bacterium]|nr:MAG: hypothetical protein EA355_04335 [Paracoccaceae bacterium]
MLLKILTLVGAALALWSMARRAAGLVRTPAPRVGPGGGAEEMVRCRACGAWRAPGATCACALPPTP